MTIYAVTSGSYSDYSIEQLFLTREKALAFIKSREAEHKWEDYRIEIYETYDECIETTDGYLDNVYIALAVCWNIKNGQWYVDPSQRISYEYERPKIKEFYKWSNGSTELTMRDVRLTVKPQLTDDQIIKIAQDEYAKWKAEKEVNK